MHTSLKIHGSNKDVLAKPILKMITSSCKPTLSMATIVKRPSQNTNPVNTTCFKKPYSDKIILTDNSSSEQHFGTKATNQHTPKMDNFITKPVLIKVSPCHRYVSNISQTNLPPS